MLLALVSLILLTLAAAPHALALKWAWDGELRPNNTLARIVVGLPNLFFILSMIMMAFFAMAVEIEALNNPVKPKKETDDGSPIASNDTTLTGSSASVENYINAAQVVGGRVLGVSN